MKIIATLLTLLSLNCYANQFTDGPVINGYGKHANIVHSSALTKDTVLKVVFDVSEQTGEQELNRHFNSLARFINMHVANGVPLKNIHLALVVHGKAGFDLLSDDSYHAKFKQNNPNTGLLALLQQANTKVFICGQSAAYYNITAESLVTGVNVELSAMTANALLQQQGYTLNPF